MQTIFFLTPVICTIAFTLPAMSQEVTKCSPASPRIEAGLKQAIAIKKIKADGELPKSVREYMSKIQDCISQEQALAETGLKIETIQKLEDLGENPHAIANALIRGLTVANRTGEIGQNSSLSFNTQSLVRYLRRGERLSAGIEKVGIKESIVNRLLTLGGGQ